MATHSSVPAWRIPGTVEDRKSTRLNSSHSSTLALFTFMPWRKTWQPTPVFLPGKSHGQRSLVGYSPWGRKELDTTEQLHFHFSLSCIGEGNGNPLQCSCLENPRDSGAWWAAVYGVTQSVFDLTHRVPSVDSFPKDCQEHHVALMAFAL